MPSPAATLRNLALLSALAVLPASAQTPSQPVPEWSPAIETVDVHARPGPAVWHLTRGDSEVWILGTVGAMPKDLDWNKQYLAELLDGARAIILPPRASVGVFEAGWFLLTNGSKLSLPRGQKLEAIMPEAMRARFVAVRTALGKDAGHYETDTPIRAAIRLQQDFSSKSALTGQEPMQSINRLARDKHVPSQPAMKWEAIPVLKDVLNLTTAQQQVCLAEAVEDVDRQSHHAVAAAEAWAVGDIKGVKAHIAESRLSNCIVTAVHSFSDMNEQTSAAFTTAIDAALDKPGKTIAVIGIANLLRKGGVLDRLQARHIAIEGPVE